MISTAPSSLPMKRGYGLRPSSRRAEASFSDAVPTSPSQPLLPAAGCSNVGLFDVQAGASSLAHMNMAMALLRLTEVQGCLCGLPPRLGRAASLRALSPSFRTFRISQPFRGFSEFFGVFRGLVDAFPSSTPFLARLLGFLGFPGSSGPFVGFFFFSGFPGLPPCSSLCLLFRFFLFFSSCCGACRPPALSCTAHLFARGPRDFPRFRPEQGAVERIIVSVQEKNGSYASCRLDVGPAEALRGRVFPLLHQRKR